MLLQGLMESFLGVASGINITGEVAVVMNVLKQLFNIVQDLCFTLSSGEAGSWVTIAICNGRSGGAASVSLSRSGGLGALSTTRGSNGTSSSDTRSNSTNGSSSDGSGGVASVSPPPTMAEGHTA